MYLENYERFIGDGTLNAASETLAEFLEAYNPSQYPAPFNTTDIMIFRSEGPYTHREQSLKLLMIKRKNHPCIGLWACPGGFVDMKENLEVGAARELEEETGIKGLPLVQLRTWGDYGRDPRWRVITTSYASLIEDDIQVKAGDDAAAAAWFEIDLAESDGPGNPPPAPSAGDARSARTESDGPGHSTPTYVESGTPKSLASGDALAQIKEYRLTLTHESTGERIGATVRAVTTPHKILSETNFELVQSEGIAADHACLIVHAILYILAKV